MEAAYLSRRAQTAELNQHIHEAESRHGGDVAAAYDETEPHVISLVDSVFVQLEEAARPLAGVSATVQILAVACLEAHINTLARASLRGALYDEFERATLGGKWLLYPALKGLTTLDAGNAVIRDVHRLASRRNDLVHPKRQMVEQEKGFETPTFLERLHLTGDAARLAVGWVRAAVTALAIAENRPLPDWLNDRLWPLFRHEWVQP